MPVSSKPLSQNAAYIRGLPWLIRLPSFCAPIFDDQSSSIIGIDFWAVEPSDDAAFDRDRGRGFAAEAIRYANAIGQPEFVDCVILWITGGFYDHRGSLDELKPLSAGFVGRIFSDDPAAVDRVAALVFAVHPQLRN